MVLKGESNCQVTPFNLEVNGEPVGECLCQCMHTHTQTFVCTNGRTTKNNTTGSVCRMDRGIDVKM